MDARSLRDYGVAVGTAAFTGGGVFDAVLVADFLAAFFLVLFLPATFLAAFFAGARFAFAAFAASARTRAQRCLVASAMAFRPAALSLRLGLAASGVAVDSAAFLAAHL